MSKPTFTISRASPRDVPRLGEISTRAFDRDTNSQMKIMGKKPGEFADGMVQAMQMWIESPRAVLIKATDDRDGTIVGFCAWGFRGLEIDPSPAADEGEKAEDVKPKEDKAGEEEATAAPIPGAEKIEALEKMTGQHIQEFMSREMPEGSKCIFIGCIAVDQRYKRQGIGSQLVSWGTEQADRFGAFSWVHASEAGWYMFEKHGYKEADRLTFDLDEYAIGPPPKDGVFGDREKWGKYTFRYGLRQPVQA